MEPVVLLTYYCALILAASIVGGMIPLWFRFTHRWMEFAVSFVAGVMLGVGVLHLLPHAITGALAVLGPGDAEQAIVRTLQWLLVGMLAMFFIERFFSFHQHDVPPEAILADDPHSGSHDECAHDHDGHDLTWSGATLGLTLHSVLAGVALAASVQHEAHGSWLAGFGTFLVIFLHKPFDSMTIGMLMARGGWSIGWRHAVNGLFSLAIPLGAVVFYLGLLPSEAESADARQLFVAYALAFSAGVFLCIALSDLLPELHFHQHDRGKLSVALLLGLAVAILASYLEHAAHAPHTHETAAAISALFTLA